MPRVGVNVPKRRRPRAVHTVVIVKIHTNENVGVAGTLRAGADTAPAPAAPATATTGSEAKGAEHALPGTRQLRHHRQRRHARRRPRGRRVDAFWKEGKRDVTA